MTDRADPPAADRLHYAWIVAAITFLFLLVAAGIRGGSGVLIVPLEREFGWTRATISIAFAVSIFLTGFLGPFSAALIQSAGVRRTALGAFALLAAGSLASLAMTEPWQFVLTWGVLTGAGAGVAGLALAATLINRWFVAHRGLVMGLMTAGMAGGQLLFLPTLGWLAETGGWRPVAWVTGLVALAVAPLLLLLADWPRDKGLPRLGESEPQPPPPASGQHPVAAAFGALATASASRDFWLLAASFFVCGLSTSGLVATHLIPYCFDYGIPETTAASLLAFIGVFNVVGTTASGWLTDRFDSRWLLCWYYGLRGLSLLFLPFSGFNVVTLTVFAVFYGLDWIATVPPTVRLSNDLFGRERGSIVFGWLLAAHQVGGALAAWGAGLMRTALESYLESFLISGLACVVTAGLVLAIGRARRAPPAPAAAAA
jgi:MFS family permease